MYGDVIAAISTPPGKGGVAVIRMSGVGAVNIADVAFRPLGGRPLSSHPPRMQVYGHVIYNEEKIDDALATRFEAGSSYTGEETVEISCHGGTLVSSTVLEALLRLGARVAEPGEFTRRAHLNGRLSLTEAEAIATVLDARSVEQLRLASSPSRAKLNKRIDSIRLALIRLQSSIFARIDYPEEDLGELCTEEVLCNLRAVETDLSSLIRSYNTGRAINEGISTVICGKPNVGKSTLYNLLLGEDAAIVTDIAGTTRDVLSSTVPVGRVLLRLSDTAGIRAVTDDAVERIGIDRSLSKIKDSELILALFDLSRPLDSEDAEIISAIKDAAGCKICILTKSMLQGEADVVIPEGVFNRVITVSAKEDGDGAIEAITEAIEALFYDESIKVGDDAIVSSARQHAALSRGLDFIKRAIDAYEAGIPEDAASSEIERALGALGEVDGRSVNEEIIKDIFARFCVGK